MDEDELIARAGQVLGKFQLSEDFSAGAVAAAILTDKGNVYTGICIDLACGIGFCAEHAAMAEMLKARETRIEMVVALCADGILPPCGRCREMMHQVDKGNLAAKVIVGKGRIMALGELLPERWI